MGDCAAGGYYQAVFSRYQGFVVSERDGRWGKAIEVPGLGVLNAGGNAQLSSVSCGPAGSCAAGGYYQDSSGHRQAFVVSEQNGAWGTANQVPGLGKLNTVPVGGQLRGGRVLQPRKLHSAGVRGQRAERRVGHGDRAAWPGEAGRRRLRFSHPGVLPAYGRLRGWRVLHLLRHQLRTQPGIRDQSEMTTAGASGHVLSPVPRVR